MPTVVPAAPAIPQLPAFLARCNSSTGIPIITSKGKWEDIIIERLTTVVCGITQGLARGGINIPDHTDNRLDLFQETEDMTPDTAPGMVLDTTVRATTHHPGEMSEVLDSLNLSWQLWPVVVASISCYSKDKSWLEMMRGGVGYT